MSNPEAEPPNSPESTSLAVSHPQHSPLSRKLFFLSMGTAATPVFVAAGIMLQTQHAALRHSSSAIPGPRMNPPAAEAQPGAGRIDDASMKATSSSTKFAAAARDPQPARLSVASLDYRTVHLQSPPLESNIFERETLLSLISSRVPDSLADQTFASAAVAESSDDSRTASTPAGQGKKVRVEFKTHAIAHHRHRPQKPEPTLLARIGRSVKKALVHAVTFARD